MKFYEGVEEVQKRRQEEKKRKPLPDDAFKML